MATILAKSTSDRFVCGWRVQNCSTVRTERPLHGPNKSFLDLFDSKSKTSRDGSLNQLS